MITCSDSLSGSGMPNQVDGVLVHTMSGTELSHVRTELQRTGNTHSCSATSSTSEPPDGAPAPPWQCSCADASPGECSDVSTPGLCVPPPARPPPARNATRNCLAC